MQRNFTDPDSRVLLTKDGFIQGYNAQAAVDGTRQIIVAHGLTQSMSDCPQLVPLVDAVRANLGRKPREISADAGYCSEDNLLALATRKIHAYVATGRAKHPAETSRKVGGEMTQTMREKLKRAGYRSRYRLRKQIVEPVFGQPISNPHAVQTLSGRAPSRALILYHMRVATGARAQFRLLGAPVACFRRSADHDLIEILRLTS